MTSYEDLVKKSVLTKPVYEPGRPIDLVARESGLDPAAIDKLASNENPMGPSPKAMESAIKALADVRLYPENDCYFLREKLADRRGLGVDQLIFGRGSSEIINLLGHAFIEPGVEVVMGEHAFISYKIETLLFGGKPVEVPLVGLRHDLPAMAAAITPNTRLVFLPSPNNPTGTANTEEEIFDFATGLPDHVIFCFDEAYAEYLARPPDLRPLIEEGKKVICLRTFSKIYGLAGLRVGYGYAAPELCELLNRARPPFNVNSVAQAAALAALDDEGWVENCRILNRAGLEQLEQGLTRLGVETVPSQGNFILAQFEKSDKVYYYLRDKGIIVRPLKVYSLPRHLRITVGAEAQNRRFLACLAEFMNR